MATKQIAIRMDVAVAQELKVRSAIENRSVNEIVNEAVRAYTATHPISRERMLAMVRSIAREDADLLKTLAEA